LNTPGSKLFKPAPTGELERIEPQLAFPRTYDRLTRAEASITFAVGDETYRVDSRFSTPDGQWAQTDNRYFRHQRQVVAHDEWIEVRDTFTNLTDEVLAIMQQHTAPVGEQSTGVWLAGLKAPTKSGRSFGGQNPSVFSAGQSSGVGLVALNDVFRVHCEQTADTGSITLADSSFVLQPRDSYTAELAIVPTPSADFWQFVNQARRTLDVNFKLDIVFGFLFHEPPVYEWSDETFRRYIDNKSINFAVKSNYGVRTAQGHPARCTDWLSGPHTIYCDFNERVHRLFPDGSVKTGIYFHCFLDTTEANKQRYAADHALDSAGNHITYGQGRYDYMSLYVPTLEPGHWGEEIAKVVDVILDDIGCDGVFWDEFAYSTTPWIYSHLDGCSADIDAKTHKVTRLKGSLPLLSLDFRLHHVRRIMERGPLIINGAPWTRTIMRTHVPAFTETGSISHTRGMLLYSPVALGDHITERTFKDAYRIILQALDHGCLYVWYPTQVAPEQKTIVEHMYPFTPLELHSGYVIGEQRIITSRSGLFGWGDDSDFTGYVYDRDGKPTDHYPVQRILEDGKAYAEVRIPEGYSVALVRGEH